MNLSFYARKRGKGESWRVVVRLRHKNTKVEYGTPWSVPQKHVARDGTLKPCEAMYNVIDLMKDWEHRFAGMAQGRFTTARQVLDALLGKDGEEWSLDILAYAREDAARLLESGRVGTGNLRITMVRSIERYIGENTLDVGQVTARWLNSYVAWLTAQPAIGNRVKGTRAASLYIAQLKAVYNKAKREFNDEESGKLRIPFNPFARMEKLPVCAPAHRALTVQQLRALMLQPDDGTRAQLARDVFMLSFFLVGMNAADLYECAADVDGKITYERKKTRTRRADRAEMTVTIPDEAKLLVEHYRGRKGRLFRFSEMYSSTNNFNRALNLGLKQIGEVIGVENLQFYAARHTWATLAVNDVGVDKYTVHQALNHVDGKTAVTDIYIRKSWDKVDRANRAVIDYVMGNKKPAPILSDERGSQTSEV